MAKKYKLVRMPLEVFEQFHDKKIKMEKDIRMITGREIPLTMPKVWRLIAKNPVEIDKNTIITVAKKKGRKKYEF